MVLVGSSALLPKVIRRVPRANGEDAQTLSSPINGGKYNAEFRFGELGKLMKQEFQFRFQFQTRGTVARV